jgi:internalin A
MSSPKPRRRWYQFSLITLLIGLTLFSLPLGYIAWEREQCRRGEEALKRLDPDNSNTRMVFQSSFEIPARTTTGRPDWLKYLLGNDQFRTVHFATLTGESITDNDLELLTALPNLHDVIIQSPQVTDEGVAHLPRLKAVESFSFFANERVTGKGWEIIGKWHGLREVSFRACNFRDDDVSKLRPLTNLRSLHLNGTNITDSGLEGISQLASLEGFNLSFTNVSDSGLRHLAQLTNLQWLNLSYTKAAGTGLTQLSNLPKLESLNLRGSNVTDNDLAHIAAIKNLKGLDLSDTEITDAGLAHLRNLKNLESLDLARTNVSDAGLQYLKHLENLKGLCLGATGVTDTGAADLKKSLPNAFISHWSR